MPETTRIEDPPGEGGGDEMSETSVYDGARPTEPGWYWCRNECDESPAGAEFICHVYSGGDELYCSWMTHPGQAAVLHESEWDENATWRGPLSWDQARPVLPAQVLEEIEAEIQRHEAEKPADWRIGVLYLSTLKERIESECSDSEAASGGDSRR